VIRILVGLIVGAVIVAWWRRRKPPAWTDTYGRWAIEWRDLERVDTV